MGELVLPIDDVIGMMLPVLMLADLLAIGIHWRKWDERLIILLIPPSIAGVVGTLFLTNAPSNELQGGDTSKNNIVL